MGELRSQSVDDWPDARVTHGEMRIDPQLFSAAVRPRLAIRPARNFDVNTTNLSPQLGAILAMLFWRTL